MEGSFYDEFVQPLLAKKLLASPPHLLDGTPAAPPSQADLLEKVLKSVQGAVLAVLGAAVGADRPLMEAGLDSLGETACRWPHAALKSGVLLLTTGRGT